MYRDGGEGAQCPRCGKALKGLAMGSAGNYWQCGGCGGALVTYNTLAKMWQDMQTERELVFVPREKKRAVSCPMCRNDMEPVAVVDEHATVPLDWCKNDGVWFDTQELAAVLATASMPSDFWWFVFRDQLKKMR